MLQCGSQVAAMHLRGRVCAWAAGVVGHCLLLAALLGPMDRVLPRLADSRLLLAEQAAELVEEGLPAVDVPFYWEPPVGNGSDSYNSCLRSPLSRLWRVSRRFVGTTGAIALVGGLQAPLELIPYRPLGEQSDIGPARACTPIRARGP